MTTPDDILKGLYEETLVGNAPRVLELTEEGLTLGMEPQTLLFDALIPSLEEVGARFERGDFFVPEMLIAGRAMAGAMERLRPLLAETGVETVGKFLMGTVKGDVHDIGKNLVNIMLEGAGFEVIDLGVQVALGCCRSGSAAPRPAESEGRSNGKQRTAQRSGHVNPEICEVCP